MDEILLENSISRSPDAAQLRKVFAESEPWRSYCEFAARRLKEKYFSDEEFFKDTGCSETIMVRYGKPLKLTLRADADAADKMLRQKIDKLGKRSFEEVFLASLREIRENPDLARSAPGVKRSSRRQLSSAARSLSFPFPAAWPGAAGSMMNCVISAKNWSSSKHRIRSKTL